MLKILKVFYFVVFSIMCFVPQSLAASDDPARELAKLIATKEILGGALQAQLPLIEGAMRSSLADEGIEISSANATLLVNLIFEEMLNGYVEEFENMYTDLYSEYFTAAELDALIEFYSTDIGLKTLQVIPLLMQEGAVRGQALGVQISGQINERVERRLERDGIELFESKSLVDQLLEFVF